MAVEPKRASSLVAASIVMFVVTFVLFFVPLVNGLVGGAAGGLMAGSAARGVAAAILPAVVVGLLVWFGLAGLHMGDVGFVAGMGSFTVLVLLEASLILGAALGGAVSSRAPRRQRYA